MTKKYYAVKKGVKSGIYTTWKEASKNVLGYSGAQYKSFRTLKDAEAYIGKTEQQANRRPNNLPWKTNTTRKGQAPDSINLNLVNIYVEGQYDEQKEMYSFGAVLVSEGSIIKTFSLKGNNRKLLSSKQVAGILSGVIHSLNYAIESNYAYAVVHYDYLGVENFAMGLWRPSKPGPSKYVYEYIKVKDYIHIEFQQEARLLDTRYGRYARKLAKDALL